MAARKRQSNHRTVSRAAATWMAIVASATFGVDTAARNVQAKVTVDPADLEKDCDYRLVVQSYDGELEGSGHHPVGSVQRAVQAAELSAGLTIELLELRPAVSGEDATCPTVVAWVEAGKPDLELDGRMARPRAGSVYGMVRRTSSEQTHVSIRLNRKLAGSLV
jgi:hypothetical protein